MHLSNQTNHSPFRDLFRSAPLLILRGVVISSLQFFAKRAIYAQADESALAAYGIYSTIEGLIFLLIFRGLRVVSRDVSHLHAKEISNSDFDPETLGALYRQGVLFGCLLMIPSGLLCVSAPTIFKLAQQSDDVVSQSNMYFFWGFLGYFGDMLYRSRARVDVGRSQPQYPLLGDCIESAVDALGTYVFVNGKCGFPKMGVSGGAVAYALGAWITALSYNAFSYFNPALKKYALYRFSVGEYRRVIFSHQFKKMMVDGLHIALKFSLVYLTVALTTFLCGLDGASAVIGLQAAGAYTNLVVLPIGGFSDAASVIVGRLFKNHWNDARKIGNFALIASCAFAVLCAITLFVLINPVTRIFMNDDKAHQDDFAIVKTFLQIQAVMEVVNSFGNVGASVLSGCNETRYPFLLSAAFICVFNSLLTLISHFCFRINATAMYALQLSGLISTSSGMLWRWYHTKKPEEISSLPTAVISTQPVSALVSQSLWQEKTVSSRHTDVDEMLPEQGSENHAISIL